MRVIGIILLQAKNLTKRFEGKTLLTNVNLQIKEHGRIALIGRNGVGKSTLVRMLLGYESVSGGQIMKKNHLRVGYLAQNTGLHSNRTILQEMRSVFKDVIQQAHQIHRLERMMGSPEVIRNSVKLHRITQTYDQALERFNRVNGYSYRTKIRGVLSGFGFTKRDYYRNINQLSGGQQSQLALAKLLLEKKDLLILDEPTNHIDVKTITWLENYLQNYSGALLVISHDRYFLNRVAHEVYNLADGSLAHYYGNYDDFVRTNRKRYRLEKQAYLRQQAKIRQAKNFIQRNIARASTAKRAKSRRKQLAKVHVIQKPIRDYKVARFRFHTQRASGTAVLDLRQLAIGYHQHVIASPINLSLRRNQAVAIIGPNGIGKSTLLKTIIHQIPPISGTVQFGTGVSIGYYDQKQATLHPQKTVLHELWDEHPQTDEGIIRAVLGSFLFSGEEVKKRVSDLSGGEKARLQLTKLSMKKSNLLLLDEPTNHLDIASREVLETALKHFRGTLLFVSHDRYFINQIATDVMELSKHGSKMYLGNYDYYVAKKSEERAVKAQKTAKLKRAHQLPPRPKVPRTKARAKQLYRINKHKKQQKQKLQRTVGKLEKRVSYLDRQKRQIEAQMAQHPQDVKKLTRWQTQIQHLDQKDRQLTKEWETKGLQLEEKF